MRRISRRAMVSGSLVAAMTTGLGVAALSGAGGSSKPAGPYPRGFEDDGAVTYGSGSRVVDIWTDFSCSHCAQLTWDNQSVITSLLESRTISLRIHPVSILGQRWTLMAGGPWAKVVSTQKDASPPLPPGAVRVVPIRVALRRRQPPDERRRLRPGDKGGGTRQELQGRAHVLVRVGRPGIPLQGADVCPRGHGRWQAGQSRAAGGRILEGRALRRLAELVRRVLLGPDRGERPREVPDPKESTLEREPDHEGRIGA